MTANPEPLRFTSDGVGEPIVFLHGYPLHHAIWEPQLKALAAHHRIILIDLPGYGASSGHSVPTTQAGFAEAVRATLESIGATPATLVGHSFGGYVALQLHHDHPALFRRLVLVSTRSGADTPEAKAKRLATVARLGSPSEHLDYPATVSALVAPATEAAGGPTIELIRSIVQSVSNPTIVATLQAIADRPDLTASLRTVRVPTLVVWGERDRLIPPDQTQAMVGEIRSARGVGIPEAGHLSSLEQPSRLNQALSDFLAP
jgi:pimeloyl-ACP methyl ester carboxylesterase